MALHSYSQTGQAAYLDLLRLLGDERVADIRGKPTVRHKGQHAYWYDRYRLGDRQVEKYIGPASPELDARLARAQQIRDEAKERSAEKGRLVRLLRSEGYRGMPRDTGRLLKAFSDAGLFRLGGTLVGTVAFILYEAELGVRFGFDDVAATNDLDIASFERLSLAVEDRVERDIDGLLADFDFEAVPGLDDQAAVWRWRQSKHQSLVEFLTPSFEAEEGIRPLEALGVHARALHHLNFLIAEPIAAVALYRHGVLVQIPRPERYAIHKLIVADRREGRNALKAHKDRRQADLLIEVLAEDRPEDLAEAADDALARGQAWRARIAASLERLPEARERLAALGIRT